MFEIEFMDSKDHTFDDNKIRLPERAWWSGDAFLVACVAAILRKHLSGAHGYPSSYTEFSWRSMLGSVASDLEEYATLHEDYDENKISKTREALHQVADIFHLLWD